MAECRRREEKFLETKAQEKAGMEVQIEEAGMRADRLCRDLEETQRRIVGQAEKAKEREQMLKMDLDAKQRRMDELEDRVTMMMEEKRVALLAIAGALQRRLAMTCVSSRK